MYEPYSRRNSIVDGLAATFSDGIVFSPTISAGGDLNYVKLLQTAPGSVVIFANCCCSIETRRSGKSATNRPSWFAVQRGDPQFYMCILNSYREVFSVAQPSAYSAYSLNGWASSNQIWKKQILQSPLSKRLYSPNPFSKTDGHWYPETLRLDVPQDVNDSLFVAQGPFCTSVTPYRLPRWKRRTHVDFKI
ncbi:hypothetical protein BC832DRAFT_433830 [Gaertneriomyces semiglobifer]|nr:hypothetical protein BC832DRAFT_433830 [Gaertneriomyces semiglobifer]